MVYSCDAKLNFQSSEVFSVTWSFRNRCNGGLLLKKHFWSFSWFILL